MPSSIPTVDFHGTPVSAVGFGAMGLSEFYGGVDADEAEKTIELALDSGVNFIDTADMYGSGANESLLKPFLQGAKREKAFICTKFGIVRGPGGSWDGVRGDAAYVKEACEKSLERLGVETIDLYYQHRVDPKTPIEETVQAMKELQDAGKIRHIGLSECSADTLRRASKVAKIAAVQWEYSVMETSLETNGVLDACKELGVKLVAYSPLCRGLIGLVGEKWHSPADIPKDDFRAFLPRFQGAAFTANLRLVQKLKEIAAAKGVTAGQLALAWVIDQGAIPIPGTKRRSYLEQNIKAADVTITVDEHAAIRALLKEVQVEGDRYADMSGVNA